MTGPKTSSVAMAPQGAKSSLCDHEPIHRPGAIQPHGALLAAPADTLIVSHASANLESILCRCAASTLGRPLAEVIGERGLRAVRGLGASPYLNLVTALVPPYLGGGQAHLRMFRSGRHVCVDIEPLRTPIDVGIPDLSETESLLATLGRAESRDELVTLAVRALKAGTGYDRVMAYRFDEDGHGEVMAEDREADLESFLGHHYPASDIPVQARRLYLRQRVGTIADVNYVPAPLLVDASRDDGTPLDLTFSALRSVSPLHRQFMRNMGTAASLTVGLPVGAELWGMLVCHHLVPRIAGPQTRAFAAIIGRVVSRFLDSLGRAEIAAQRRERDATLQGLVGWIADSGVLAAVLTAAEANWLGLMRASGALARVSGAFVRLGRLPPTARAERAFAVLESAANGEALAIDDLGLRFPELADCAADCSGAFWLPLGNGGDDAIVWFRPEWARDIIWGGDPNETSPADLATGQVGPRASFAAWKTRVRGRSRRWSEADREIAHELKIGVAAAASKRAHAALREMEAKFQLLAENSSDIIALCDIDGTRRYVSPAAKRVLGWRPEDMTGRNGMDFVHPEDQQALKSAFDVIQSGALESSTYYRHRRADGDWLWVEGRARLRAGTANRDSAGYVVVLRDATQTKEEERKLKEALERVERLAETDDLTGLANRRRLRDVAEQEWRRCAREGAPLSVLLLDADRFKLFNDRYGHLAGDRCLREIADQLHEIAGRPGDLAARYGGEEFMLMMPDTDHDGAVLLGERLCGRVRELRILHEGNVEEGIMTISVGAATARPGDPASAFASLNALIAAADAALYRAKREGRNRVCSATSPASHVGSTTPFT